MHHLPTSRRPISVKFEHKTWNVVVMNSFGTEFRNFSEKGHYLQKPDFGVFGLLGTLAMRELHFWPLGLQRIWALRLKVEGPKMFTSAVTFFIRHSLFEYRGAKSPLISGSRENPLHCRCRYRIRSLLLRIDISRRCWLRTVIRACSGAWH